MYYVHYAVVAQGAGRPAPCPTTPDGHVIFYPSLYQFFNLACECLYHGEIFHVEIEQVENSNITPTLSFNRTKTLDRSTLQYCTSALGSQTHTHRELNIIIKH